MAYLTAWYRNPNASEKNYLLNQHISTIKKDLATRKHQFDGFSWYPNILFQPSDL